MTTQEYNLLVNEIIEQLRTCHPEYEKSKDVTIIFNIDKFKTGVCIGIFYNLLEKKKFLFYNYDEIKIKENLIKKIIEDMENVISSFKIPSY